MASAAAAQTFDPMAFLERQGNFSAADFRTLDAGKPVGKLMEAEGNGEAAILGAIRLARPKEDYLAWFNNVENYRYSPITLDVGLLSNPPAQAELDRIALDPNDLKAISECRPGDCQVKLAPSEIERFQAAGRAAAPLVVRGMVADFVRGYWSGGNASVTADRAADFLGILDGSAWLRDAFPDVFARLRDYAGAKPGLGYPDREFVYWSRERYGFGLKPLLNIYHVTVHRPVPELILIASRQLRSTHYFDGSLGVMLVADAVPGASYLIYVNRSRVDLLRGGGFAGIKRWLFERRLPGEIRKQLTLVKTSVEKFPSAPPTGPK